MATTTCGDVTVTETDSPTDNAVRLGNCSLSASDITAGETLTATVEATNTLAATAVEATVQMTAPRAVGSLPSATVTIEPGETVRVEGELIGNDLGVSSEPFTIGWEVTNVSFVDDGDGGFTTDPIQLDPASL